MVKVSFPLNLDWDNIQRIYETPFAATFRPYGHFAAQTWVDCADNEFGVTLFNYGTPGYWIEKGVLELILLRSFSNYTEYQKLGILRDIPGYENSTQTQLANEHGSHSYKYSLLPHKGSWKQGHFSKIGQSINIPLYAINGKPTDKKTNCWSDLSLEPDFLMTALKLTEDGKRILLRGYETSGQQHEVKITLPNNIIGVNKANLLEQPETPIIINNNVLSYFCSPHEILTLLLEYK